MKPEITMCNYYGMCDANGDAIGHTVKVTNEYSEILKEKFAVKLAASPCIVEKGNTYNFIETKKLKYNICVAGNSIAKRFLDKIKLLSNIHQIINKDGIYFFYQVDFFFFFYMLFFYRIKRNRKIICLVYHQDFAGGKISNILQGIYKRALKKLDGVIYTQNGNPIIHSNAIWIPDFFYSDEQYGKYRKLKKKKQAVCVGTMNRYKKLEELLNVFTQIQMPLIIVGRFDDKERYQRLLACKTENIEIRDEILTYEEYMEVIATSQYSILPYDMEQYVNRTSGVLLESLYLGSIPVGPIELLLQNRLPGIGYESMTDLLDENKWDDSNTDLFAEICEMNDKKKFVELMSKWVIDLS